RGSARRRRRQADLDDQQPDSGARGRQGAGAARPRSWRAHRRDPQGAGIRREGDRRAARERRRAESQGTGGLEGDAEERQTQEQTMSDIVTERSNGILRVELNRPERKNALTGAMYTRLAEIFNEAAEDEETLVVLWHGAGDAFSAGNDVGDFLKNPPGPGESPQARLMDAFVRFEKPIVVAVQGAAIGGGTTMLTHCDVVYAG